MRGILAGRSKPIKKGALLNVKNEKPAPKKRTNQKLAEKNEAMLQKPVEIVTIDSDVDDSPNIIILDETTHSNQSGITKQEETKELYRSAQEDEGDDDVIEFVPRVNTSTKLRSPKDYAKIPMIPIYSPTPIEFENPLKLIESLKHYEKYGAVVIRAPPSFKPVCMFDFLDRKVTTRVQIVQNLSQGKPFEQKKERYTRSSYEKFANKFAKNFHMDVPDGVTDFIQGNEYKFWSMVEHPEMFPDEVAVEYAADLPSATYGSAFPLKNLSQSYTDPAIHFFNLLNVNKAPNSLFQVIKSKADFISGINSPWVYMGMMFASFCWHVEDLNMISMNYMHKGSPKTWYVIPSTHKEQFDALMKKKYAEIFREKPDIMYQIVLTMSPLEILDNGIPIHKLHQRPGDFVVTFPKVYHAGFSHGFNIGEAINIATVDWIGWGRDAVSTYAGEGFMRKTTFPIEWLLVENLEKCEELIFSPEVLSKLISETEKLIAEELKKRVHVRQVHRSNALKLEEIPPSDRYYKHTCKLCKSFCYLSALRCDACGAKTCVSHMSPCGCQPPNIVLMAFKDVINRSKARLEYLQKH